MYVLTHIGLIVKDAEKSRDFYQNTLGFDFSHDYQDERIKILFLKSGNVVLELVQRLAVNEGQRSAGPIDHLAFQVKDITAAMKELQAKGIVFETEQPRVVLGGKKNLFFAGPDGERLEIIQD